MTVSNSLNSILRTASARLSLSDTGWYPIGGFLRSRSVQLQQFWIGIVDQD